MEEYIIKLYHLWQSERRENRNLSIEQSTLSEQKKYEYRKEWYIYLIDDICRLGGDPYTPIGFMSSANKDTLRNLIDILKKDGAQEDEISAFCRYLKTIDETVVNELRNQLGNITRTSIVWLSAILVLSSDALYGYDDKEDFKHLVERVKKVADEQLRYAGYSNFSLKSITDIYIALSIYQRNEENGNKH